MATLLYNPDRKDKQQFINEFVIRTRAFDDIYDDLKKSKMKYPEQHYMLLGQRGSGKTTLLLRLKYAIEDDKKLNKWLIPIMFSEEQYHISEVVNIWEHIAGHLEDHHNFLGICHEMAQFTTNKDFEAIAFDILLKHLDRGKKKLVLFIDNIGDLLKKLNQLEIFRLREILQTTSHLRLIAASSAVLDGILDYQQPFFEFFKMIQLKGLTSDECKMLLKKLAEIHGETEKIDRIINETPSRIETLRTLSGGIPRTIALLFQVFVDNEHGTAVNDLEKILDAVTPLYKHRMDDLPAQQQKIVDAVARNWEAVSVKELTERLRLESKVISAQLRQLEKNQVVEKRTTGTKNHIYLLRERFFNIWYLMRYGRKEDRQRVIWLVRFLEVWCDSAEIERRITDYIRDVEKGALDERTMEFFAQVYSHFKDLNAESRFLLKESAPAYVAKYIDLSDEEFDILFDKYLYEEDWRPFIKMISGASRKITVQQMSRLHDLLQDPQEINKRQDAIMESEALPDTSPGLLIAMHFAVFSVRSFSPNESLMNIATKSFSVMIVAALEEEIFDDFKEGTIEMFVFILLIRNYTHLALSILNGMRATYAQHLKDKFRVMYYVALYLADIDKGKAILQALGSELEVPVLHTVQLVLNERAKRSSR